MTTTPMPKFTPAPEPPRPGLLAPDATPEEREAWRTAARTHTSWLQHARRGTLANARERFAAGEMPTPEEVRDLLGLLCTLTLEQLERAGAHMPAQQQLNLPPQLAAALPQLLPALMGALGGGQAKGG